MSEKYYNFDELSDEVQNNILCSIKVLAIESTFFKKLYFKILNDNAIINNNIFTNDISNS